MKKTASDRTRASRSRRSCTNPLGIGTLAILLTLLFIFPALLKAESLPEVKTYDELRHAISEARAQSRGRVEQAVEKERVREAWEIGRLIDAHVLQHKERADYGEKVLERLAGDLGMSRTELSYMLQFARTYPIYRTSDELTWGHYESLLALNDSKERDEVAALASKEKWPVKKLREEVSKRKAARHEAPVPVQETPLTAQPGKPETYKIILAKTGPYAGEFAIDLGFSNYVRLGEVVEDARAYKEGEVLSFSDTQGEGKELRVPDAEALLYTYEAYVHRVLDGDTIEAVVDLGFGITTTQTLRLRGIDAPELVSKEGKEAKAFLEQKLKSTEAEKQEKSLPLASGLSASPVLIRTVKSDKYDRYLADVFLPARSLKASAGGPGATGPEGNTDKTGKMVYLNGLLLEKGYAVRVRE